MTKRFGLNQDTLGRRLALALVVVGVGVGAGIGAGCKKSAPPPAPAREPASTAEIEALGHKIEESISRGDLAVLNEALDLDALFDRALEGAGGSDQVRESFAKGAKSTFNFPGELVRNVNRGGQIRFLGAREIAGGARAVIRMVAEDGFNYLAMLCVREAGGKTRVIDIYTFTAGQDLSGVLRDQYKILLPKLEGGAKATKDAQEGYENFGKMRNLALKGEVDAALKLWETLPEDFRAQKGPMAFWVATTVRADEDTYKKALAEYEKRFPNDPSLDLMLLDGHFLAGDYAGARARLDRLDKTVGGDPYLDLLRGNSHLAAGETQLAKPFLDRVAAAEPGLIAVHDGLLAVDLAQKDWPAAMLRVAEIEKRFGTAAIDPNEERFELLRETDLGKAWVAARSQPPPAGGEAAPAPAATP